MAPPTLPGLITKMLLTEDELALCQAQGRRLATLALQLALPSLNHDHRYEAPFD